jgi:hypothetical protein
MLPLGFCVQQHEFGEFATLYLGLFGLYLFTCRFLFFDKSHLSSYHRAIFHISIRKNYAIDEFSILIITALLLRLALLFAFPKLSNDIFRFIWDGRLLLNGINPFDQLPFYYLQPQNSIQGIDRDLFEAFGSKNTYSVYPPIAQLQFLTGVWLGGGSDYWSAVAMKIWNFLFESGNLWLIVKLLAHLEKSRNYVLLYALNPLIIIELTGNLHFEAAMIFFVLLAVWLLFTKDSWGYLILSGIVFSLAVSSKLLPLLLLPFFFNLKGWRKGSILIAVVAIATVAQFLPFLSSNNVTNFAESLNLYFQKLEFNASFYYLLRWIGFQIAGYNMISWFGPALGLTAFAAIMYLGIRYLTRTTDAFLFELCLAAITIYLLSTTTLHPWYLSFPIVLCIFTDWRFPVIWTLFIAGTYINYSYEPYHENLWFVAVEYIVLVLFIYCEWKTFHKKSRSPTV